MWKLFKRLFFSLLSYWIILYLIDGYSAWWLWLDSWFSVTATQYNEFLTFGILAAIFWVVNGIVKGILKVLTLPLRLLTLWLFSLVLNMLMIYIFEFVVNNYSMWVVIHLWTIVQVFILSLLVTIITFLVKKIT